MKYLRLFQTHAEHEQERKALEKLGRYTSYCEDNKEVTIFHKKKSKYAVGDYLLSSGEVIKNADYTDQEVIGVCVIPDNFISQEGINSKARFCALTKSETSLQYKTSDTEDTGLSMFGYFGSIGGSYSVWIPTNIIIGNSQAGQISCQVSHFENGVANPYDPGTYWADGSSAHIASPYLYVNGEYIFNEGVYNGCVDDTVSMFSDMDGKANTGIINDSDHPAAQYCATYSTNGTSQGDWYLPAMGELGFIMPRFDTINSAITKVGGTTLDTSEYYWSSTQVSTDYACSIGVEKGIVSRYYKTAKWRVRPFLCLD